jgi:RNA polymerase sigma factor (sigma-70 family)
MFLGKRDQVLRQVEVLWTTGTLTGLSDAQLLRRFAQTRDAAGELAFRELVNRHGPMVLGVCRQVLRHAHDADDAFQATFLVLVRKAQSMRTADSLAPWLYSVAYRTAQRARATAVRYRPGHEEQLSDQAADPEDACKLDLRPLLHEELGRLPAKYRAPIVLCHLEGKTHEEAARLLRWPVGTVSGRLSRGRRLLRDRLQRRGIEAPAVVFSAGWLLGAKSLVTPPLAESMIEAATRFAAAQAQSVSAPVLSLTQGVLKTMMLRKLGTIAAAVVLLGAVSGAGVWAHWSTAPTRLAAPAVAPVPSANPTPQVQPQPSAGSETLVAENENCPTECPLTGDDNSRPYCPISMAAHAIRGMIGYFHDTPASR